MPKKKQKEANRTGKLQYQDSLFRHLFSTPEKAIELYNAVKGTNYSPDTKVDLTTLDEVFFNDRKNDLGFIIDIHYVIMTEHQSTICRNMPLRMLGYAARTFEKIIPSYEIYSSSIKKIPIPEFYVLYTGDEPWNETELRLSNSFLLSSQNEKIPENSMELVVKIIDLRYTEDNEVLKRSETLAGYSLLLHYIKTYQKDGMTLENAIDAAIDRCLSENILVDFLKNKREVSNMILGEGVTWEEIIAVRERDAVMQALIEDNLEEGIPKNKIIKKLMNRFSLNEKEALQYFEDITLKI